MIRSVGIMRGRGSGAVPARRTTSPTQGPGTGRRQRQRYTMHVGTRPGRPPTRSERRCPLPVPHDERLRWARCPDGARHPPRYCLAIPTASGARSPFSQADTLCLRVAKVAAVLSRLRELRVTVGTANRARAFQPGSPRKRKEHLMTLRAGRHGVLASCLVATALFLCPSMSWSLPCVSVPAGTSPVFPCDLGDLVLSNFGS